MQRTAISILFQFLLQGFDTVFHRSVGIAVRHYVLQNFNLLSVIFFHVLTRHRNHRKAAICHNHSIVIPVFHHTQNRLTLGGGKLVRAYPQDLRRRVHLAKHVRPLIDDIVRHDVHVLVRNAHALQFHTRGNHNIGLPRAYVVRKQGIRGKQNAGNRILLVGIQFHLVTQVRQGKETTVKLPRSNTAVGIFVNALQFRLTLLVPKNPTLEHFQNLLLLIERKQGFLFVDHRLFLTQEVHRFVHNLNRLHIQGLFNDMQSVHTIRTKRYANLGVVTTTSHRVLVLDFPRTRHVVVRQKVRSFHVEKITDKRFHHRHGNPRRTDRDMDLVQIHTLGHHRV